MNGGLVSAGEARIDPGDRGFTLADGCFDTALSIGGRVFRADHHLTRLAATCEALSLPVSRGELERAQSALAAEIGDGSIRITVTRGTGARGLALPERPNPTVFGSASAFAPNLVFAPLTIALAQTRRNETSLTARHKTLSYLDAIIETNRVRAQGANEPVFLNSRGHIACTALANLFEITGGNILTPPLADGVLDGVMRRFLLENGAAGIEERSLGLGSRGDLAGRHFVLTNSLRLIAPARIAGTRGMAPEAAARVQALMETACHAIRRECGTDPRDLGVVLPDLSA
ncbi:class IV aminotransferase [Fulvimarina endophytica]|uniref:Probable branched-chain-amino-acid aminotransferase n=2 Tax=Fulvimarina endophytica TaxID=2293836 RepID=A0A371X3H8_9HYPH|nr:class IV aminotransferase [Fulvimarina endophytica]